MSDIRVSVQWKSSAVFAGDNVECTITFRNVAPVRRRSPSPNAPLRGPGSSRERWKDTLPTHFTQRTPSNIPRQNSFATISTTDIGGKDLAVSPTVSRAASEAAPLEHHGQVQREPSSKKESHRRSLSIVSIGNSIIEEVPTQVVPPRRPSNGHSRSASMQILPRRNGFPSPGPTSAPGFDGTFAVPSPIQPSTKFPFASPNTYAMARSRSQTSTLTAFSPPIGNKKNLSTSSSMQKIEAVGVKDSSRASEPTRRAPSKVLSPRPSETADGQDPLNPVSKILSPASINGTPRSSGEFYSLSNNSTETLASEYVMPDPGRSLLHPGHSRQSSVIRPPKKMSAEVLMMGFGQVTGSCVLDRSLINQAPFEDVKRKAIVGGRGGGGVVRSDSKRRENGLLKSLGWGNFGDSIGGLLGGNEISSIKEAKKSSSDRSIPILSTPQSVLFVDLRLEPGESKTYSFSHPLPKGLPPTHKGKAMKTTYNLVIGTQRANQATQSNYVQRVEVPFKVMTSINANGEVLGHDLMSPHTILTDQASTSVTENRSYQHAGNSIASAWPPSADKAASSSSDFTTYVDKLLAEGAANPNQGLLSPTEEETRNLSLVFESTAAMKDLIDGAILRSNVPTSSRQIANRFEIKRGGDRVAAIMLARPAFRLGETVPVAIDFKDSDISCYSMLCSLETRETIDPLIALRSKASILRATRKVYASKHESTISAERIFFSPTIPPTAVPEFMTSGISLEWALSFEFVTSRAGLQQTHFAHDNDDDNNENDSRRDDELLEEVLQDERGTTKAAVQGLLCETFEVTVPLRVYGAVGAFEENNEGGEFRI